MDTRLNRIVFAVIGVGSLAQLVISAARVIDDPAPDRVVGIMVSAVVAVTMAVLFVIETKRAHRAESNRSRPPRR
ncbi:hypothetical protein HQQ81_07080 [Microbacteriaceae bacterium VKM Ac-2854]|nr:hypothetical protein [Microbacteriaceae bacterium VKM Ac-2854]